MMMVLLAALGGCGGGGDAAPRASVPSTHSARTLSISITPQTVPSPTTPAQMDAAYSAAFDLAYGAGARGQSLSFTWKEIEPADTGYDPQQQVQLADALSVAQAKGMTQYVGIQLINTNIKELPADLAGLPFDDARVVARFRALLDEVVGKNRGRLRYLSIGNEVDAYLTDHPAEVPAYQTFYQAAVSHAHTLDPALQVGVTGSSDAVLSGNAARAGLLQQLNAVSDVVMLTYYPLQTSSSAVTVRPASVVASDFASLLGFAGSKPLVLQEVGYPASPVNGSSEAAQAEFVRNVFTAWQANGDRIPFLNVFVLHDFTAATCDSLVAYYHIANPAPSKAFFCSLGLRKTDGSPRAAWQALVDGARDTGLP
jgi:hypothetical protein